MDIEYCRNVECDVFRYSEAYDPEKIVCYKDENPIYNAVTCRNNGDRP